MTLAQIAEQKVTSWMGAGSNGVSGRERFGESPAILGDPPRNVAITDELENQVPRIVFGVRSGSPVQDKASDIPARTEARSPYMRLVAARSQNRRNCWTPPWPESDEQVSSGINENGPCISGSDNNRHFPDLQSVPEAVRNGPCSAHSEDLLKTHGLSYRITPASTVRGEPSCVLQRCLPLLMATTWILLVMRCIL